MNDNQPTTELPWQVQTALVYAARYVHHRETSGSFAVCGALSAVWDQLTPRTREEIIRESHEATANLSDWADFRREKSNDIPI